MRVALIMLDPMVSRRKHRAGGAAYALASYVKGKNPYSKEIDIKIFNFNSLYTGPANINICAIADYKPDIIGFSTYCWNMETIKGYIKSLKSLLPKSLIIMGGPEVSYNSSEILASMHQVDVIIRGEGEITFDEFVTKIFAKESDFSDVLGITYRDKNGCIVENPDRPLHPILDDFPSPFQTGIIDLKHSDGEVVYETVRGCMFKCSYCLHTKGMNSVREYSMERVEKDLKIILQSPYVKIIWFLDPTFNSNEERALKILKIIEKYNPQMPLAFELRADLLSVALIEQLGKVNTAEVGIGLQSYSEKTNEHINRKNNISIIEEKLKKLHRTISHSCHQFDIDLIYGLPGDTYNNYKKSVDYIISLNARIYYQPLRIFKGTKLYEDVKKYGIIYNNTPPYNIITNNTYSLDDMISSYCLNVGIDYFNRGGVYKGIVCSIVEFTHRTYSDCLEDIGRYFWNHQMFDVFRIANWTPDDREEKVIFNDFLKYLDSFYKEVSNSELKETVNALIIENKSIIDGKDAVDDCKSTYFHLAI